MDPISTFIDLAKMAIDRCRCKSCGTVCGGGADLYIPGVVQGYETPCNCAYYCLTHFKGWYNRVKSNNGQCPNCGHDHS